MSSASLRGAVAGAIAAATWAAGEPALRRLTRTSYSDVRLLGRAATRGRGWPVAGVLLHVANGALFGAAFGRLGRRGLLAGVAAAETENLVLWPALVVVDRVHPDRRDGTWPPLARDPRVALQEIAGHALFGAVLGVLTQRFEDGERRRQRATY